MTAEKMNTENRSRFLSQVSEAHNEEFIVMVVDGASSHKSKELEIPKNMSFIRLPPYSPELNPALHSGFLLDNIGLNRHS